MTLFGLFCFSNQVNAQDVGTVTLMPIKPGLGGNTGGSRNPEEYTCPLSVNYSQSNAQLLFDNLESTPISFAYYLFDEDEALLQQGNIVLTGNGSYLLNISNLSTSPFVIRIVLNGITYEGYLGTDSN